jgi:hypothetical protein
MTGVRVSFLVALAALAVLDGCATRPINPPITRVDVNTGYTFQTRQKHFKSQENLVVLAFSGGGTRAAAFSYGVLEFLRRTEVVGPLGNKVRLLDAVDVITGVSGGSFTALAYGLYGDNLFADYEQRFLKPTDNPSSRPLPQFISGLLSRHIRAREGVSSCRGNIGLTEIFAFEKETLSSCLSKRISEAVPEVKPGAMSTLAEIRIGLTGNMRLLLGYRFNDNAGAAKESIELPAAARSGLSLDNDPHFDKVGGRDSADVSVGDSACISFGIAFAEQDREQSRGVDYHRGMPRSS